MTASTNDANQEPFCRNILSPPSTAPQSNARSIPNGLEFGSNKGYNFGKVLIIGLGQLGLPVAKYVTNKGFDVHGYDVSYQAIDRAEKLGAVKKAFNFNGYDVYIICISTHKPNDMFTPDIAGLFSLVTRISSEAKDGALLSIESTVPKGTSRKIFDMLNHRLHVVHAPHRWYALDEKEHGVNQPRVIGGVSECCLEAGMKFYSGGNTNTSAATNSNAPSSNSPMANKDSYSKYKSKYRHNANDLSANYNNSLDITMHPVSQIELAETTKTVENAHRYLQIAFAEELYLYCQTNNISFPELRDALNTKWNVNILEPREGIGGHCLPKDTKMYLESTKVARSKILEAAIDADRNYQIYRQKKEKQRETMS